MRTRVSMADATAAAGLVWFDTATGEFVDRDATGDRPAVGRRAELPDGLDRVVTVGAVRGTDRRGGLTWFGGRLHVVLFAAMFQLRRGRDAPGVLDDLLARLVELQSIPTCDRFRS